MSYKFKNTYKLRVRIHELRVRIHGLQAQTHELRVRVDELQVTSLIIIARYSLIITS